MDTHSLITSAFRWPSSRRKVYIRRRKPQVVRLGGRNSGPRGRFSLKRVVRRMKFKWLRLYYVKLVKMIKGYYRNVAQEFADAGAATIQQRMTVETAAFAAPGLGLSFCPVSGQRFFLV
ncbi:hypothetical protein BRARA_A03215 [Brassica rapa]|uniref:Uncharacterized protein n=2 Tax=Brassica TaxID=3705 RepID=A0A398AYJ7_BRACM|nr:uncharacterized protein LOC103842334 [Brassica rapa]CAF2155219.1 unnamed protein product [Brassica napus]RID80556.1 hypothetical protein BRARA_A03215 [Brassica rapa]CAG7890265.1 unnamed protein product [Brassica rapa]CDY39092.1 BnaA01g29640D [Brassica napus]VDC77497.1 unnamed protein product [Brassica rapa]